MALDTEWAWLAGMVDADGCFKIAQNRVPSVHLEIGQNHLPTIDYVHTKFGGRVDVVKQPNGKPFYRWHATAKWLRENLDQLLPFLVRKKDQAEATKELLHLRTLGKPGPGGGAYKPERQAVLVQALYDLKRGA